LRGSVVMVSFFSQEKGGVYMRIAAVR
jgi:hypothetical protein